MLVYRCGNLIYIPKLNYSGTTNSIKPYYYVSEKAIFIDMSLEEFEENVFACTFF